MGKQICIDGDKFCQRTLKAAYAAHHAVDLIAGFESGDAATDLHHRARHVEAKNRRQRLLRMGRGSRTDFCVERIDAAGMNSNQYIIFADYRTR
jgi:hypothetical protein